MSKHLCEISLNLHLCDMVRRYLQILLFLPFSTLAQQIVDPCFLSVTTLGKFYGSEDIQNVCACNDRFESSNVLEWDGSVWQGAIEHSQVNLPPPPGCTRRAIWMGYQFWTFGGEAVALRLDKPLKAGQSYKFPFTYASDGAADQDDFSPIFYTTNEENPEFKESLQLAFKIGRLPPTDDWVTDTLRFTAAAAQDGDFWLIIHAKESSGMILANCDLTLPDDFLGSPTTLCLGEHLILTAPSLKYAQYIWDSGETTSNLVVTGQGTFGVTIRNQDCTTYDAIAISDLDCEVRVVMPNYFSPNGDAFNARFLPIEHNYVSSGVTRIINRWGKEVFSGGLFEGWNGLIDNHEASPGVYYYRVTFIGQDGTIHHREGPLTLAR